MGSKMAAASRVVQVVKPHVPAIRFPDRKNSPKPSVQEALKSMIYPFSAPSVIPHQGATGNPSSGTQNTPSVHRVPSKPDTLAVIKPLPQKYRRKILSNEEMEYIQRGGPE
ncbi:mitochondrial ribosomal protein S36 S homeolog [Xenopus laevis]|uniref:LOC100037103 protein n=2 Tax=Xenopus laevis TaxID=8355 RepID=A2BD64_XENLA|nr:alpha-ketoglutarate dehydrogenase subunit 4 S homeolog [Xenopus laevis]AAI28950.1 LOC100037103 protein [Xenopus laevis]OCT78014.1 hypothetical protein XELAEV_18029108mg [Xenopus laevis]